MPLILGFDVGTTRSKLLVYDPDERRAVATADVGTPVLAGADGDLRDAEAVFAALVRLTEQVASAVDLGRVAAVAVASVGEEVVLVDERGLSRRPTPTWYAVDDELIDASGGPAHREASWHKLFAIGARRPDDLRSATSFTDLGSYLESRVMAADRRTVFMDLSHASRTALLAPDGPHWSHDALDACGAGTLRPPRLLPSGTVVGTVGTSELRALGVPATAAIVAGGHDHFCGAFGAGVRRTGEAYLSVGTSESHLLLVDRVPGNEIPGIETGYFVDASHRYVHASAPSGRRFAEILDRHSWNGGMDALYEVLTQAAAGSAPAGSAELAGELLAELHAQARRSAQVLARLQSISGTAIRRIVVGGVPVAQPLWREIRSSAAPMPLEFVEEPELTALGVAMLAEHAVR